MVSAVTRIQKQYCPWSRHREESVSGNYLRSDYLLHGCPCYWNPRESQQSKRTWLLWSHNFNCKSTLWAWCTYMLLYPRYILILQLSYIAALC